ncbi:hypothetical protein [uncultured Kordia sp.]|uniref:hypothetical protein n=1 Tax=uncultured Kordia sp. TaxID=507699 RepID=UPI002637C9A9|nr:hypothetical protein [uncultured Kordia sp.]
MKNTIKTVLVLFLFTSAVVTAQDIKIPENVKLEKAEDYTKMEPLVLESIAWLQNTSLTENPEKRKKVNAFLIQWLTGSPTVSIELVSGIVPMECADCLMTFLAGWTKYSLENNYSKDKIAGAVAGVEHTIEFYKKNKDALGKQPDIEKLMRRKKKGKLEKFIKSKF